MFRKDATAVHVGCIDFCFSWLDPRHEQVGNDQSSGARTPSDTSVPEYLMDVWERAPGQYGAALLLLRRQLTCCLSVQCAIPVIEQNRNEAAIGGACGARLVRYVHEMTPS